MGSWLQQMDPDQAQQLLQAFQGAQELQEPVDPGLGFALMAAYGLVSIPIMVFMFTSMATIFLKAGKPWWAALIPIYNIVVLLEIVGKPLWWLIMFFIPGVGFVFAIMAMHALSRSFGKDVGFTVGMLLLPVLFYPMLAFGTAQYEGAPA